ncbi:MAG: chemotaxis protein CheC [Ignavibacteriales bacterium]
MSENDRLLEAMAAGIGEARRAFELMVPVRVSIKTPDLRPVRLSDLPALVGAADRTVVATYSRVAGDITGHLVFAYDPGTARRLASLITGEDDPGEEMGSSAVSEISNVAGSQVLNFLSNATGLRILPSPPAYVSDMAGAILQSVLYDLAPAADQAMVLKTEITLGDEEAAGFMILIPGLGELALLVDRLGS